MDCIQEVLKDFQCIVWKTKTDEDSRVFLLNKYDSLTICYNKPKFFKEEKFYKIIFFGPTKKDTTLNIFKEIPPCKSKFSEWCNEEGFISDMITIDVVLKCIQSLSQLYRSPP